MKRQRNWIALTLAFSLVTASIHGESSPYMEDNQAYSAAYMQSNQTAHWSAYLPIGVMVVAAICFGIADKKHDHTSSKGYSRSSRYSHSNYTTGCYSHY